MTGLDGLVLHFLPDIYGAGKVGVRSLAKLMRAVESEGPEDAMQPLPQRDRAAPPPARSA